jgi:hypothetical protein
MLQSDRVRGDAEDFSFHLRHVLTGGAAVFLDFLWHVARRREARMIRIDESRESWCLNREFG